MHTNIQKSDKYKKLTGGNGLGQVAISPAVWLRCLLFLYMIKLHCDGKVVVIAPDTSTELYERHLEKQELDSSPISLLKNGTNSEWIPSTI